MDFTDMTDDDFYAHKRAVDQEASRRTRRDTLPAQITALIHDATDAGIADEDVRATVEGALNADDNER